MSFKNRALLILLGVLTLGVYPLIIFNRQARINYESSATIKIDIDKLITTLGTKANISGVEYTSNKLKVFIYDRSKVEIKNLIAMRHVYSVFQSHKYVSFIVGPSAKLVSAAIADRITH